MYIVEAGSMQMFMEHVIRLSLVIIILVVVLIIKIQYLKQFMQGCIVHPLFFVSNLSLMQQESSGIINKKMET